MLLHSVPGTGWKYTKLHGKYLIANNMLVDECLTYDVMLQHIKKIPFFRLFSCSEKFRCLLNDLLQLAESCDACSGAKWGISSTVDVQTNQHYLQLLCFRCSRTQWQEIDNGFFCFLVGRVAIVCCSFQAFLLNLQPIVVSLNLSPVVHQLLKWC
jgi:hypothetical protein